MQFSLVQALTVFLDPWTATQVNYFLLVFAGFLGAYYFSKRVLNFNWQAGTLGALFFSANGFSVQHISAGHLNFQGFSLLPFLFIGLMDASLSPLLGGILLSVIFAILVYSASFYPLTIFLFSMGISLPLAFMLRPAAFHWKRMTFSALWGLPLTLGLTGSKLYAVISFMRFFPREIADTFNVTLPAALKGFALQLLGTMTLAPFYSLMGWKMTTLRNLLQAYTGAYVGLWELDLSLTPVLWLALAVGVVMIVLSVKRRGWPQAKSFWAALILLVFAVEISIEFTLARGFFYPFLKDLPILSSLHMNPRYGSAFIFPLALAGAAAVHQTLENLSKRAHQRGVFVSLNLLAVIPLGAYLLLPIQLLQRDAYDIRNLINVYENIQQGETYPVKYIIADLTDLRVFQENASNLRISDMIFGYKLGKFKPQLHDGPVSDNADGSYNMTNPTGFVFPEINNTSAFGLITSAQELDAFTNRRQPETWKIPMLQEILDWLAPFTLAIEILMIGWVFRAKLSGFLSSHNKLLRRN
jgi:hypothetical protein